MEVFAEILNRWNLRQTPNMQRSLINGHGLTCFAKSSILDVSQGSKCASVSVCLLFFVFFTGEDVFSILRFYWQVLKVRVSTK